MYDSLDYIEVLHQVFKVMDTSDISLSMDNRLPIVVFNMSVPGNITRVLLGERIGTIVASDAGEGR